ncbi:MAG TPA: helix-turn-helix transcriptional regulator [Thermoanaerobaculia bacterium]
MKAKDEEEDGEAEGPASDETRRLMGLVQMMARSLGYSNAALARRAKVSLASLVRYFKGDAEPRLEFLIAVIWALGLTLRDFFELAYPHDPPEPTESRKKIEKLLGPILPEKGPGRSPLKAPETKPEPAPLRREDIERMLEELRRDVREIMAKQAGAAGAPETASLPPPRNKNGKR